MSPSIDSENVPVRCHARVLSNESDGSGRKLSLAIPGWPPSIPGQFLMLAAGAEAGVPRLDPLLPRPMAVYRERVSARADATPEVEILFQVVGRGTGLLAAARPGDTIKLVGPLGRGFPIEGGTKAAILVGGGTGIASLHGLAEALLAKDRSVLVILGARSEEGLMGRRDFEALDVELICTTEDGSAGIRGRVTDPLAERLREVGDAATVYAVGPTAMMRACASLAHASSVV